ncbi:MULTISPECIES: NACHT domain-containing NTPase [Micromonospora]|uniref:NACHT domain-containing protein n=1 Tax=Micromonospora solifontis TaxID=2487138 RepID=A0ABX9WGU6_9ACTN|nr:MULTISPECIES: hypothetical protein [Micromonospora]NES16508.1 hypothetical protein [Micromonospora sp. PPF5-17B]NES37434.1 hypothetical protein [Micromonospora solifontis]NES58208.1 hypothetical protein [Micromonospora sp. PPF5-6]RNL98346.1 hypothetical protein EFE23_14885 [Micromonospora solifontis]
MPRSPRAWTPTTARIVTAALLLALLSFTWWMLATGTRGAEIANVLALPLAAVSLLTAVVGSVARPAVGDPAVLAAAQRRLSAWSARQETELLRRALLESGELQPANLRSGQWKTVPARTDGGQRRGSVRDIASYYQHLDRGRLVVLGEPGSGKSVALAVLVLGLLKARAAGGDASASTYQRVPVRLSLPTFDPGPGADQQSDLASHDRLRRWLVNQVAAAADEPPALIAAMVEAGMILPVLDGLDEMDADREPATRAALVVRALNCQVDHGIEPVVVACRRARYEELRSVVTPLGERVTMQDASVVLLEPLTIAEVAAYLTRRFPAHGNSKVLESRWAELIGSMRADPDGRLATALRSPLRLFLAIRAYQDPTSRPADLRQIDGSLDHHLFARLIPATLSATKPPAAMDASHVQHWLSTLSRRLRQQRVSGQSGTDLPLHTLSSGIVPGWPMLAVTVANMAVVATCMLGAVHLYADAAPQKFAGGTLRTLTVCAVILTGWRSSHPETALRRFSFGRLRTPSERRALITRGLLGLLVGTTAWAVSGLRVRPAFGVLVGLTIGAAFAVGLGSERGSPRGAPERPSQVLSQIRNFYLVTGTAVGLVVGMGLGAVLVVGVGGGTAAACGALLGAAAAVLFTADSPWPPQVAGSWAAAAKGDLPHGLNKFLDWAHEAGLLRLVNLAVQFRHHELQTWLNEQASPTTRRGADPTTLP